MNMIRRLFQLAVVGAFTAALCAALPRAHANGPVHPIIVDTDESSATANGNCDIREAIQAANTDLAVDGCRAGFANDVIAFNIGESGSSHTITLESGLAVSAPRRYQRGDAAWLCGHAAHHHYRRVRQSTDHRLHGIAQRGQGAPVHQHLRGPQHSL